MDITKAKSAGGVSSLVLVLWPETTEGSSNLNGPQSPSY